MDGVKRGATPIRLDEEDLPSDAIKHHDCDGYVGCLMAAADGGWKQFACGDCPAYEPDEVTAEDFVGLSALSSRVLHGTPRTGGGYRKGGSYGSGG